MRSLLSLALFLASVIGVESLGRAGESAVSNKWEAVYARDKDGLDQKIGFSRIASEPIEVNGKELIRTTRELDIKVKRGGQLAHLKLSEGTEETAAGKVVGVFMKMGSGQQTMWNITGAVNGKQLSIQQDGLKKDQRLIDWDDTVISLQKEQSILADKKVKPGDKFDYRLYASTLQFPVTIHTQVEQVESVPVPPKNEKRKLLRVESQVDEIQGAQLPGTTTWVDPKTYEVVMTQTDMAGFGILTFVRTSKEIATGPLGNLPDMMDLLSIRLRQRVQGDIHTLYGVQYKITTRTSIDPTKLIKAEDRQKIKKINRKENTFELQVEAKGSPEKEDAQSLKQYLESNHFITSADPEVQRLAKQAVGATKDPLKQAQLIEKFVRKHMTEASYTQALDTAAVVAKSKKGDCTEFSMLTAAMCRAVGIPSRTAIGLIYVDRINFSETPILAFHMWTEVYIDGKWLGLDSTLARGSIGPGHIKITDHSWHKVESMLPLLPVQSFIQTQPAFEILGATVNAPKAVKPEANAPKINKPDNSLEVPRIRE